MKVRYRWNDAAMKFGGIGCPTPAHTDGDEQWTEKVRCDAPSPGGWPKMRHPKSDARFVPPPPRRSLLREFYEDEN